MKNSPLPVQDTATCSSAQVPAPISGLSVGPNKACNMSICPPAARFRLTAMPFIFDPDGVGDGSVEGVGLRN